MTHLIVLKLEYATTQKHFSEAVCEQSCRSKTAVSAERRRENGKVFDLALTLIDETEADLGRLLEMCAENGVMAETYQEKRPEPAKQGRHGNKIPISFSD